MNLVIVLNNYHKCLLLKQKNKLLFYLYIKYNKHSLKYTLIKYLLDKIIIYYTLNKIVINYLLG